MPFVPVGIKVCVAKLDMSMRKGSPSQCFGFTKTDPFDAQGAGDRLDYRYAIGGGHVLHVVCDLTIAANNAIFGQTGPKVGSFDGGFGSSYLARIVGQKKGPGKSGTCAASMMHRRRWIWGWSIRWLRRSVGSGGGQWW